tara:strand:- start:1051 stop:1473 length:423 start_codon:yes stop_codon:yes gene_type:complete
MVRDQLFKTYPTNELFMSVVAAFGFSNLEDIHPFSRNDLKYLKTVEKINMLKPYLEKCYIPCKARTYLHNLNEKNVITILRHLLKLKGYTVSSKEKYIKGDKFILYRICKKTSEEYEPLNLQPVVEKTEKSKTPTIITFN